ncbi:STAS domain-containing protein [Streptomyces sp. YIM 132580]|uniref:STAS domain-containing protein n=1 Tax=Streptomyces sp. YIM 132580 TaxID=2691958 RepID=UPI0013704F91|nr:STAS domain-containing protein [Streptomyces sp. YIM 132580]MXG25735.1 STAS domain-containing protein [Streptomyces sp. YIM 132580]
MSWRSRAHVRVREEGSVFVVEAVGELDIDERDLFAAAWDEVDERCPSATVLDLAGVTFADSSFLDSLLRGRAQHLAAGRGFVVAGPLHPSVRLLLDVTGVSRHLTVAASLDEALLGLPRDTGGTSD